MHGLISILTNTVIETKKYNFKSSSGKKWNNKNNIQ